jgi:hypothetical protein
MSRAEMLADQGLGLLMVLPYLLLVLPYLLLLYLLLLYCFVWLSVSRTCTELTD